MELKNDVLYVKDDIPMIYYLDFEKFESVMARLAETQIVLDEEHTETHLTGTLNITKPYQRFIKKQIIVGKFTCNVINIRPCNSKRCDNVTAAGCE